MNKNQTNKNARGNNKNDMRTKMKEAKNAEIVAMKEDNFTFIKNACNALNERIAYITNLRKIKDPKEISKDDTKIVTSDIKDYFEANRLIYPAEIKINTLIGILIDIARCQVNTKLENYHVSIRLIYFSEKFQSFFGKEYNDKRDDICSEFEMLFNTHGYEIITFEGIDKDYFVMNSITMPINRIGVIHKNGGN